MLIGHYVNEVGRLPIKAGTIEDTLFAFLRSRHTDAPRLWSSEIACNPEYAGLSLRALAVQRRGGTRPAPCP